MNEDEESLPICTHSMNDKERSQPIYTYGSIHGW